MVAVAEAIQYLFPASVPLEDWNVRQDSTGAHIAFWNPALGTQPTPQQLAAVTDAQVAAAKLARKDSAAPDLAALRDLAAQAVADINTYLAIADAATNVQVRAEVKAIGQRQKQIIKALAKLVAAQV